MYMYTERRMENAAGKRARRARGKKGRELDGSRRGDGRLESARKYETCEQDT
jgi:hypothetical protein